MDPVFVGIGYTVTAVDRKHALSVCLEHSAAVPASEAEQGRNIALTERRVLCAEPIRCLFLNIVSWGSLLTSVVAFAYLIVWLRAHTVPMEG